MKGLWSYFVVQSVILVYSEYPGLDFGLRRRPYPGRWKRINLVNQLHTCGHGRLRMIAAGCRLCNHSSSVDNFGQVDCGTPPRGYPALGYMTDKDASFNLLSHLR